MRRTIPTTLALSLLLMTTPALAADEASPTDEASQRIEAPRLGIAMAFPAGWRVSAPVGDRVSALTRADDEPVMETTAFLANGGGGTWCDVDAYLDMIDAPLDEFAYSFVSYLQQNESAESAMVVGDAEIASMPAYRIEIFNQSTGRLRGLYLFDSLTREDGTFERFVLDCATRDAETPFWETLVDSIELFPPAEAADEMADSSAEPVESAAPEASDEAAGEG
jgi:hypothetical protein